MKLRPRGRATNLKAGRLQAADAKRLLGLLAVACGGLFTTWLVLAFALASVSEKPRWVLLAVLGIPGALWLSVATAWGYGMARKGKEEETPPAAGASWLRSGWRPTLLSQLGAILLVMVLNEFVGALFSLKLSTVVLAHSMSCSAVICLGVLFAWQEGREKARGSACGGSERNLGRIGNQQR
jgi:hypothetical protein